MKTSQPLADGSTQDLARQHELATREAPPVSPTWTSASLLRGQKAVAIEHNGALYRLQSTRAGKLILTK